MEGSFHYFTQFKGKVDAVFISRATILNFLVDCVQGIYCDWFKIVDISYINWKTSSLGGRSLTSLFYFKTKRILANKA